LDPHKLALLTTRKIEMVMKELLYKSTQWRGGLLNEMVQSDLVKDGVLKKI
jgi:hypothetical protein